RAGTAFASDVPGDGNVTGDRLNVLGGRDLDVHIGALGVESPRTGARPRGFEQRGDRRQRCLIPDEQSRAVFGLRGIVALALAEADDVARLGPKSPVACGAAGAPLPVEDHVDVDLPLLPPVLADRVPPDIRPQVSWDECDEPARSDRRRR